MDQKTWLWKKRSAHKSIESNIEVENEAEKFQYDKEPALERTIESLHEKVASLLSECNAKDNLIAQQSKAAQEAIADRYKIVEEMGLKNQELDAAVQQNVEANERLIHLNSALKDYRQQLTCLKEEQDQQVNEAVDEHKTARIRLEEKFADASKKLTNLTVENAQLVNALLIKEELIEEVSRQMSQATIEFNELITRLDSADKENDILKYEYRVLERELEIRARCADVANRQNQESVKRAVRLDAECKKLRLLVKKQIAGSNDKRLVFLINRLCEVEEENKSLKENMQKRDDEIRVLETEVSRIRCDETHGNGVSPRITIGDSDMSLMDDFVEMEKLAIVCADTTNLDSVGKELVPVENNDIIVNPSDWLQDVIKTIVDQTKVSNKNIDEVLKEIKTALQCRNDSDPVSGYITWKDPDTEKNVKTEADDLKETKMTLEEQLENQKLINEELDHKLSVAQVQINEANQKVSALKVELEDRSHCCEELEATCLDLQLQLASVSDKDAARADAEQELKMVQTGWEITEASAKLAQCQETIFNIGRQLKALTPPPPESAELTSNKKSSQRSSLRDVMVAEDGADVDDMLNSPKTKEIITATETKVLPLVVRVGSCRSRVAPGALTVLPSKKRGKGAELLRKLLFRKKRGSSKNKVLTIGA
ncbi:filament-like plant protein 7 [Rutidosis leptorrhynchoides]|uniref:filament-like plant protein 7 n=1 Tax=Rutidosis leptorrhynchoides TaxID=125765 RepID=UPI003A99BAFA